MFGVRENGAAMCIMASSKEMKENEMLGETFGE